MQSLRSRNRTAREGAGIIRWTRLALGLRPDSHRRSDETLFGFARALARLRDIYAPNVKLAYSLSLWGPNRDFSGQDDATVDELAGRAAGFFRTLVDGFDLVFGEFSDRDAGYKQYVDGDGGAGWWGAADYERHVRFFSTFVAGAGRRVVMWQIRSGTPGCRP